VAARPISMDGYGGNLSKQSESARARKPFGIAPIESRVKVAEYGMQPNLSCHGTSLFNLGAETVAEGVNTVFLC